MLSKLDFIIGFVNFENFRIFSWKMHRLGIFVVCDGCRDFEVGF
jgi:hypothetical protein